MQKYQVPQVKEEMSPSFVRQRFERFWKIFGGGNSNSNSNNSDNKSGGVANPALDIAQSSNDANQARTEEGARTNKEVICVANNLFVCLFL